MVKFLYTSITERKYIYELIGKGYILLSDEIDTAFQKLPSDEVDAAGSRIYWIWSRSTGTFLFSKFTLMLPTSRVQLA